LAQSEDRRHLVSDRAVCDLLTARDGHAIGRVEETLGTACGDGGDCNLNGIDVEFDKIE
jgi:hypothetical protein